VHHRAYEDAAVIDEFGGYYGVVNETPDMDAGFDEEAGFIPVSGPGMWVLRRCRQLSFFSR
jgi:hypothetical protein